MTKQAVLYARVSSDDTAKDGRNIRGQIEMCREYTLRCGWQIVAELSEDDRTRRRLKVARSETTVRETVAAMSWRVVVRGRRSSGRAVWSWRGHGVVVAWSWRGRGVVVVLARSCCTSARSEWLAPLVFRRYTSVCGSCYDGCGRRHGVDKIRPR